jgi:hypothetical protein
MNTDSDAPSDADEANLSEFTQVAPDLTKVGDEFEESAKSNSNNKNESSTTAKMVQ